MVTSAQNTATASGSYPRDTARMMLAVVQHRYGTDPQKVLRLATVRSPGLDDEQVFVRVHAASVDRGTWHIMTGLPYPIRLAGFGVSSPKFLNPGRSFAGTVVAVGAQVDSFTPGQEVFGICASSFAEYACASPTKLALKPSNTSFEHAAAVPVSGVTALQAVRDHARVQAGQHVLVVGASGGVGSFAVQIAKAAGATVTGVCGPGNVDHVRALGADHVIDYTTSDFATDDPRTLYDAIIDTGGNSSLSRLRAVLKRDGVLVIVGGETSGRLLGGSGRALRARMLSPFVSHKLGTFVASENAADLTALAALLEAGHLTPVVDRSYPLVDAPAAVSHLVNGRGGGKTVIRVHPATA